MLDFPKHGMFLDRKMNANRKSISEAGILAALKAGAVELPPLSLETAQSERLCLPGGRCTADAVVSVSQGSREYQFAAEIRSQSTPRTFESAVARIRSCVEGQPGLYPMIVAPYLSREQLLELERRGVSGLDLCGNGIVTVPGELLVFRDGAPNRFRSSAPIKNVYRGMSSLVGRALLACPGYPSVGAVRETIRQRGADLALSTVSKVLKVMEEDLLIERQPGRLRLNQPERLLDRLATAYAPPSVARLLRGKVPLEGEALIRALSERSRTSGLCWTLTGLSSAGAYSTLEPGRCLSLYTPHADALLESVPLDESSRFPNLEVLEVTEGWAYFDVRERDGCRWASPVQSYLELSRGDKRDREAAAQVRSYLVGTASPC